VSWVSTRGGRIATILALALAVVAVLAVTGTFSSCGENATTGRPSQAVSAARPGDYAWVVSKTFARTTKARPANTWGEIHARAFIFDAFQQYGYYPRTQEFIADAGGRRIHSANIIAVKQGDSSQQLVVGAHYDSARLGQGYADNASGIGLLLEMAARLKPRATPYTLVFVAFGAEEVGTRGSGYYVDTLPGRELKATLGMIDLDAVAGGERLFVTSQPDAAGWLRNDALTVAEQLGVALDTAPARPPLAAGEADAPTDSRPFARAGVATATFTSANLDEGATEIEVSEQVWHTPDDTVAYIEKTYPGRVRAQLHDLARILETLLTSKLEKTS
jgi:hypothetical protein